jgi:hypothetical protein
MPLSTPRFERDGVWRGNRTGYDPTLWPSYQPSEIAPAYGAAIESAGFTWLHARASYRRVENTGTSNVTSFAQAAPARAYEGSRVSQERLGYAVDATAPDVGGIKAGLAYDLLVGRVSTVFASVDGFVSRRVTVGADYDYFVPTFDGDSIWNFFLAMPMNDVTLRSAWETTDRLTLSGGLRGRAFGVQTKADDGVPSSPNAGGNYYPTSGVDPMGGGNLGARYRIGEGAIGARGLADVARSGDRIGFDVYGERTLETRYVLSGRAGVWHWEDDLRRERDATSFGYVAGAGYKLFPRSLVFAEFEHNMNRLAGQRVRVMLWLTIALSSRSGP